jgi:filamentous hemagglutinin
VGKKGDFSKGNLDNSICFDIKCWAQYDRGSEEHRQNYLDDVEMRELSNELTWKKGADLFPTGSAKLKV